ncbi:putative cytokinetic ring protein SteA [Fuchsiella alkaliacetigena]|uniref:putative cytokinetic ring protein SteA n=1 Tax=Fuchsiella alkaliacetigena TaxID=957042 RepID=UPI00200A9FC6|nr:putative cytokinetic ring protein SteA [Fuchsiella alkaliacetigena]MCK8824742.1 putative cytokinetic ring protein SteA [Fuchsiella alkaliacetigena]
MQLTGKVKLGRKTKELVKRLAGEEIAVIAHEDIDQLAANSLIEAGVKAVINVKTSSTGKYPNLGPEKLLQAGILVLEETGWDIFTELEDGETVKIMDNKVIKDDREIAQGVQLDRERLDKKLALSKKNLESELDEFIENTLEYAKREKELILDLSLPAIETEVQAKQVLIVVRGQGYKDDLETISSYIKEVQPVLIGVDGGADALLEYGFKPDLIVGDMDSITDQALQSGAELLVHAYPDGEAPGWQRVEKLDLATEAKKFPAPGTSEDLAMLLAYEKGAELITAVGTHSNMIDFLEKGRAGMASTFLTRLKIGAKLVDAKGVNKLYNSSLRVEHILKIVVAALVPIIIIFLVATPMQQILRLLLIKLRLSLGF